MADENDIIDLARDSDGDLDIGPHLPQGIRFTSGLEAVQQNIKIGLDTFQGEWFADLDLGVPYYQDLLGKSYSASEWQAAIRRVLINTEDVLEIVSLTLDYDETTREVDGRFVVRSTFGTVEGTV